LETFCVDAENIALKGDLRFLCYWKRKGDARIEVEDEIVGLCGMNSNRKNETYDKD